MKTIFFTVLLMCTGLYASEDLVLDGAKWEAKSSGYTCAAFTGESRAPLAHEQMNVQFELLRTDSTLDNAIIKATFNEDDSECRYSAILLADNDASTIKLVQSRAYAISGQSQCLIGKAMLDQDLNSNDYLYWGHPHHATILLPVESAELICGANATHVGIDFIVSRRISNE